MDIKKRMVEAFYVDDKEFKTKEKANKYLNEVNKMLNMNYYEVCVRPDLFKGKIGYYGKFIVALNQHSELNSIYQYLLRNYGEPISWIQSVAAPINSYLISERKSFTSKEDLDSFLKTRHSVGIGYYAKNEILKVIYLSKCGHEREFEEMT